MSPITLNKVLTSTAIAALLTATIGTDTARANDPYEALLTGVECNTINVTAELSRATKCAGAYSTSGEFFPNDVLGDGNPLLSRLNTMFDVNYNWLFVDKDDAAGVGDGGFSYTQTIDQTSGSWFSNTIGANQVFAISLKSSQSFSVYYFDLAKEVDQGLWSTFGTSRNQAGRAQGLSHMSLFIANKGDRPDEPVTKVPEPGMLLGLGLFAAGSLRKLRRTHEA
jgi:hypothetical protein